MSDPYLPVKACRDDWCTPPEIFLSLHNEFGFTIDAAASADNALLPRYWTEEDDATAQDWSGEVVWANPPYDHKSCTAYVRKARSHAACGGISVLLLPVKSDQGWWHDLWADTWCRKDYRWVKGRVKFLGAKNPAPMPVVVVVIGPLDDEDEHDEDT